jgi:hypothetical protein
MWPLIIGFLWLLAALQRIQFSPQSVSIRNLERKKVLELNKQPTSLNSMMPTTFKVIDDLLLRSYAANAERDVTFGLFKVM